MLAAGVPALRCSARCFRPAYRTFTSSSIHLISDNPIPANDPGSKKDPSPVSATNATPTSSEGIGGDRALQESVEEGEKKRVMQAPNRAGVWSRSQQERSKAMVGPRFEQTIMEEQVRMI